MKIAIVGTSQNLTENEERDAYQLCATILKDDSAGTLISGGAKGIDSIAEEVAKGLGLYVEIYKPKTYDWYGYSDRNLIIAQECDKLFCITTNVHDEKCYHHDKSQDHQRTGGCWTLREAARINKPCRLFVIDR